MKKTPITPENLSEHLEALDAYSKFVSGIERERELGELFESIIADFERFKISSDLPDYILENITSQHGGAKSHEELRVEALEYSHQSLRESHIKLQDAVLAIQERIVGENNARILENAATLTEMKG